MKKISGAYRLRTFVQLCLYLLAAVSILPAYSADAAKQKQSEEKKNGTLDAISSSFKQFGSKLGDSVSEIAADVKGIMYYSCNGTWTFTNGKCSTTLIIEDGKTMQVIQKKGSRSRSWSGNCTLSADRITFTPVSLGSSTWELTYKLQDSNARMKITSETLPADFSGYSFAKSAVFEKE